MKFSKVEIAKLLSSTPGVSASKGELLQFFRSSQHNIDEEFEGNIIENFLVFRKQLDADLLEGGEYSKKLIEHWSKEMKPSSPLPKKIIKQLQQEQEDKQKYIDNFDFNKDL